MQLPTEKDNFGSSVTLCILDIDTWKEDEINASLSIQGNYVKAEASELTHNFSVQSTLWTADMCDLSDRLELMKPLICSTDQHELLNAATVGLGRAWEKPALPSLQLQLPISKPTLS